MFVSVHDGGFVFRQSLVVAGHFLLLGGGGGAFGVAVVLLVHPVFNELSVCQP